MSNKTFRVALALAVVCAGVSLAYAAMPTFWQVSNEAEFARGDVENLSIDGYGRLTLGPSTTSIYDASAPFLWSMVSTPDGSIYVGSGNEGQVYKIDPSGKGSVFFDAEELEVHALALAPGGGLYAGTSPDGKIYKIDATGKSSVFFDPPDKYIWGLALDKAGNVFAATGDKGVVYKITPDGKGAVFYQTKTTHAITLAVEADGHVLVGTESPGRLFRLDANGKPFVLLDSPYNEIHTLKLDPKGVIYAAAVSGPGGTSTPTPASNPESSGPVTATVSVSTEITAIAVAEPTPTAGATTTSASDRTGGGSSAGGVYRITPDGAWDLIWSSREDSPFDIAIEPDGGVLIGTGNKGKIYRLSGDPLQPTLVTRATAQQVTALLRGADGRIAFTTSNPGKIFRLSPMRADKGTYTSDVRDAQTIATWGAIRWQSQAPQGTRIEISTRSGNTRTPDETWSDWSAAYTTQEGSAITSPRARYLQWRAVLTGTRGDAPLLTSVTAAYLPRNIRPEVTSITINAPGTVFQRPFPTGDPEIAGFDGDTPDRRANQPQPGNGTGGPNVGRRAYQKGLLTFTWRAQDENKDELSYDVFYRREGETEWKPLKRGLTDEIVVWDTSSVPNGRYVIRVVASDAPSNAPSTALTGALESSAFDIDNTPPVITVTSVTRQGGRLTIQFDVRDDNSIVQKAEYSLDGDRWQTIYPKDGIPDSRMEQFELTLDGEPGTKGVIIRASDALNNVASTRGDLVTPGAAAASGRR